jgi:hypothetical protein
MESTVLDCISLKPDSKSATPPAKKKKALPQQQHLLGCSAEGIERSKDANQGVRERNAAYIEAGQPRARFRNNLLIIFELVLQHDELRL